MNLLSRAAERIYWSARYLERAENTARLVRVYGNLLLDFPLHAGLGWRLLIRITDNEQAYREAYPRPLNDSAVDYLVVDDRNPGSILSCLRQARENIRTTRDIVPSEAWRCTNELVIYAREKLDGVESQRKRSDVMSSIIERCQQITGLLHGTMSRGRAYQFLRLGRNLERADMNTRIIDVAAATLLTGRAEIARFDNRLWMAVLQSLSAYQMYRQHVRRRIMGRDVIAYLLNDELFPKSLNHCLGQISSALDELPRNTEALAAVAALKKRLSGVAVEQFDTRELHQWIDDVQLALADLNNQIYRHWLALESSG